MIYLLKYDDNEIARVEVEDRDDAREAIKEMVEFWMGWKQMLEQHNGDYTRCWLRRLGLFLLNHRKAPGHDDEGWYPLDGSKGIKLLNHWPWEFDMTAITIEDE